MIYELSAMSYISLCLPRLPREIHISDSAAYFTGVAPADGTGVKLPEGNGLAGLTGALCPMFTP